MDSTDYVHCATAGVILRALEVALRRLGARIDIERVTLDRVIAHAGRRCAGSILEALDQLNLDPDATFKDTRDGLAVLLESVSVIPDCCRMETVWGLPGPASFDMHLRWSGARLVDILAALDRALAA